MKKLLIVNRRTPGFGGVETVIKNLIVNITQVSDIHVKFLMLLEKKNKQGDQSWCESFDYEIFRHPKKIPFFKTIRGLYYTHNIKKILLKEQPDAIFVTADEHLPLFSRAIRSLGMNIKLFYWPHNSQVAQLGNNAEKIKNVLSAHQYLAISTGIKRQLMELGITEDKIALIFNPIYRQEKVIANTATHNHFIYIGRLTFKKQKNLKELIDAFSLIDRPYHVTLIGDGEDRPVIADYIKSKQLEDKIEITKHWVKDPWAEINNVDALVLSSAYEGFGMVLAEALSYGVPCISSNCATGPEDIIDDGVTGYLYEPSNVEALKDKILNIMDNKLSYTSSQLKASIDPMYIDNYCQRIIELLNKH